MKEKWESECVSVVYETKTNEKKKKVDGKSITNMIGKYCKN